MVIVIGQTDQKAQKSFLDHIFAGGAIAQPAVDERQQPSLEAGDAFSPGILFAGANAGNQQAIGVKRRHRFE